MSLDFAERLRVLGLGQVDHDKRHAMRGVLASDCLALTTQANSRLLVAKKVFLCLV